MTSQSILLRIASLALILPSAAPAFTQAAAANASAAPAPAAATPSTPPHFDLAAIHPSPFANHPSTDIEYMNSGRFYARQATMLKLIRSAWNTLTPDRNRILRGPSWLDFDRFDISAHAPHGTSEDDMRLMLRALLADRFALVVHTDTKSMPAYILTVAKGGPKLKPAAKAADGTTANTGCDWPQQQQDASGVPSNFVACTATTMAEFTARLTDLAGGTNNYLTAAVVDQTGLTGSYDFQFKWTPRAQLIRAGGEGVTLFDALDKQLGLKLEPKPAPLPVVYVDSVNEKPTPNAPGLDKTLAPPPAEFEVATFKPSPPNTRGPDFGWSPSELMIHGATLQWIMGQVWNISDDMIG